MLFRNDDPQLWEERYGNASDGDLNLTSNFTFDNPNTSFVGTATQYTGTVGANTGLAIGDIVVIYQSRNGSQSDQVMMLNVITDISGTTITFKYPLNYTYSNTSQLLKVKQHNNITINSGFTLSGVSYSGSNTGGLMVLMAQTVGGEGAIDVKGKGYRGADAIQDNDGKQGEGYTNNPNTTNIAANASGGGGGWAGDRHSGGFGGGGGGGGGNKNAGSSGGHGGTTGSGGTGGTVSGADNELTHPTFGGGGGSGGEQYNSGPSGAGGRGGGGLIIIAKTIDFTAFNFIRADGNNGTNGTGGDAGGGGGGAGGFIRLVGQIIKLGSNKVTAIAGSGGTGNGSAGTGGTGSVGFIHVDYAIQVTGTTNPTYTSRQDSILADSGALMGLI